MAEFKERREWGRASAVMAMIANTNRDPRLRSKPYHPDDFNPMVERVIDCGGIEVFSGMVRKRAKDGKLSKSR